MGGALAMDGAPFKWSDHRPKNAGGVLDGAKPSHGLPKIF